MNAIEGKKAKPNVFFSSHFYNKKKQENLSRR